MRRSSCRESDARPPGSHRRCSPQPGARPDGPRNETSSCTALGSGAWCCRCRARPAAARARRRRVVVVVVVAIADAVTILVYEAERLLKETRLRVAVRHRALGDVEPVVV